ncbi:hypothetical protein CTI14_66500, partial [Methylobacterium radiotolerans]
SGGKVDFVLAGSGHIAGVINPPSKPKYGYWTGATREDHIAAGAVGLRRARRCSGGKVDFVLAGSGHIAGVINPPSKPKYGYWTG